VLFIKAFWVFATPKSSAFLALTLSAQLQNAALSVLQRASERVSHPQVRTVWRVYHLKQSVNGLDVDSPVVLLFLSIFDADVDGRYPNLLMLRSHIFLVALYTFQRWDKRLKRVVRWVNGNRVNSQPVQRPAVLASRRVVFAADTDIGRDPSLVELERKFPDPREVALKV
jgi:hypothetical protein